MPTTPRQARALDSALKIHSLRTDSAYLFPWDGTNFPARIRYRLYRRPLSYGGVIHHMAKFYKYRAYILGSDDLEIEELIPEMDIFDFMDLTDDRCLIFMGNTPVVPRAMLDIVPDLDKDGVWESLEDRAKGYGYSFKIAWPVTAGKRGTDWPSQSTKKGESPSTTVTA